MGNKRRKAMITASSHGLIDVQTSVSMCRANMIRKEFLHTQNEAKISAPHLSNHKLNKCTYFLTAPFIITLCRSLMHMFSNWEDMCNLQNYGDFVKSSWFFLQLKS